METAAHPAAIVIGRVAVYTQNRFLARDIEQRLAQQGMTNMMSSGIILMDGESVHWVVLPALKNQQKLADNHQLKDIA